MNGGRVTRTVMAIPSRSVQPNERRIPVSITFVVAEENFAHGTFGVVFEGHLGPSNERVAIKKVLQDPQYRNRELDIIRQLDHPHVVELKYHFYETTIDETFLFLIMEFMPDSLYRVVRRLSYGNRFTPMVYVRVVMYQLFRALAYIHSMNICHRDIKPHNILIDPRTAVTKLCDFGSSKMLIPGETNVFYICSRFYRSPDLLLGRENYGFEVDVWSAGCVMGEMMENSVIFLGESRMDQIAQIINILGTPSRDEIMAMNPVYVDLQLPQVPRREWETVFHRHVPPDALSLLNCLLCYKPLQRLTCFEALTQDFFRPLRNAGTTLPGGGPLPPLFEWTQQELQSMPANSRASLLNGWP